MMLLTQVFGEARATADRVIDRARLHERAAPLLDADEPLSRKTQHRAADRMAVHVEAFRQFALARQTSIFAEAACGDLFREYLLDLPPHGDARSPL